MDLQPNTTFQIPYGDVTLITMSDAVLHNMTSPTLVNLSAYYGCIQLPPRSAPGQSEDPVTSEFQKAFSKYLRSVLLTVLFAIGTPTNFLNMVVFVKHGLKERINLCLFFLSFADFSVIFLHFAWGLDWAVRDITGDYTKYSVYRVFMNNYIVTLAGFIYVSSFMTTVIAFERCACVISPFKARSMISTRAMAVIIFCAHVIILGAHFIIAAKWRIECIVDFATGKPIDIIYSSPFYFENAELVNAFGGIVFGVLIPGFCLVGITTATAATVVKLRGITAWREQSSSAAGVASRDIALTRMLIGISVLFIICTTPGFLFQTAVLFIPDLSLGGKYPNTFSLLINIQQLFTYINSSVNFFVYMATGSRYRATIRAMFCKSSDLASKEQSQITSVS